jgi:hypothetical protein
MTAASANVERTIHHKAWVGGCRQQFYPTSQLPRVRAHDQSHASECARCCACTRQAAMKWHTPRARRGENGSRASTSCTITLGSERSRFPMHESSGCNVRIVTDWKAAPVVGSCRMHQRFVLAAYHVVATGSVAAHNTRTSLAGCHFWCVFAVHVLLCERRRGVGCGLFNKPEGVFSGMLTHCGSINGSSAGSLQDLSFFDVCTCITASVGRTLGRLC